MCGKVSLPLQNTFRDTRNAHATSTAWTRRGRWQFSAHGVMCAWTTLSLGTHTSPQYQTSTSPDHTPSNTPAPQSVGDCFFRVPTPAARRMDCEAQRAMNAQRAIGQASCISKVFNHDERTSPMRPCVVHSAALICNERTSPMRPCVVQIGIVIFGTHI